MRVVLLALFSLILLCMLAVTTLASLDRNILDAGAELMGDRWFQATLVDAYFGFVTFYVWVAYKERSWLGRGAWFVLIMLLGNIAMSIYMIIQLLKLAPGEPVSSILTRDTAHASSTV